VDTTMCTKRMLPKTWHFKCYL